MNSLEVIDRGNFLMFLSLFLDGGRVRALLLSDQKERTLQEYSAEKL